MCVHNLSFHCTNLSIYYVHSQSKSVPAHGVCVLLTLAHAPYRALASCWYVHESPQDLSPEHRHLFVSSFAMLVHRNPATANAHLSFVAYAKNSQSYWVCQ